MSALSELDDAPPEVAAAELAQCCASSRWVAALVAGRPYASLDRLLATAQAAVAQLSWQDVDQALQAHPRIGERAAGADRESSWSRQEQAGAADAAEDVKRELAEQNLAYEHQFGHVFLICATGLSAADMLAALQARLGNDVETERDVVRVELGKIVALRLAKAFG